MKQLDQYDKAKLDALLQNAKATQATVDGLGRDWCEAMRVEGINDMSPMNGCGLGKWSSCWAHNPETVVRIHHPLVGE